MKIDIRDRRELSTLEIKKILELLLLVWPPHNGMPAIEKMIKEYENGNQISFHKVLLHYNNNELVGHTEIFHREIIINSRVIPILALAGVCVSPVLRGKNIGFEMVRKAFEYVDNGTYNLSIFQTNVPEFYLKLNCKLINNRFINSKSETNVNFNPWRDPNVMIYPNSYEIGKNIIDLNGECY